MIRCTTSVGCKHHHQEQALSTTASADSVHPCIIPFSYISETAGGIPFIDTSNHSRSAFSIAQSLRCSLDGKSFHLASTHLLPLRSFLWISNCCFCSWAFSGASLAFQEAVGMWMLSMNRLIGPAEEGNRGEEREWMGGSIMWMAAIGAVRMCRLCL